MPVAMTENPTVVRTERGLTIKGTRITLYQIMDYLRANYSREMILNLHQSVSEEELDDVLNYIETHREEVEAEYQAVVKEAAEIRRYWEERNRDRVKPIDPDTLSPERRALWDKLQAWREERRQRDNGAH
ncbi:MAG: DUF433 domain-containing protein [Blastocatellia bacterium]